MSVQFTEGTNTVMIGILLCKINGNVLGARKESDKKIDVKIYKIRRIKI